MASSKVLFLLIVTIFANYAMVTTSSASSTAGHSAPVASSSISTTRHPSPTTRRSSPTTRHPSPTTRHPSPTTRRSSPTTRHPSPTTRHPSPTTRHPSPTTRRPSPTTRHPSPTTRHPSPTTRRPSPTIHHTTPTTHRSKPTTKHQTTRLHHTSPSTRRPSISRYYLDDHIQCSGSTNGFTRYLASQYQQAEVSAWNPYSTSKSPVLGGCVMKFISYDGKALQFKFSPSYSISSYITLNIYGGSSIYGTLLASYGYGDFLPTSYKNAKHSEITVQLINTHLYTNYRFTLLLANGGQIQPSNAPVSSGVIIALAVSSVAILIVLIILVILRMRRRWRRLSNLY